MLLADWGGNMTMEDLANYEVKVREPVVGHYKDYTIYSLPPASSGGTHLVEILNILENYDDMDKIGVNSAEYVHRFSELSRLPSQTAHSIWQILTLLMFR